MKEKEDPYAVLEYQIAKSYYLKRNRSVFRQNRETNGSMCVIV